MAFAPISLLTPQYQNPADNTPYSGAVLKAYAAGTSTNISMATDSGGATTFTSVALNSSGNPEHLGQTIIPHVDQAYKIVLYATQAAADADTPAVWSIDNLTPLTITGVFLTNDATSGGVTDVVSATHTTSGTPTAGIGVSYSWIVETATGNNETGGTISAVTTDVTSTSEDFDFTFNLMAGGSAAAEKARLTSAGEFSTTGLTLTGLYKRSVTTGITAGTTQTQAGATALTTEINEVTVSGTDGDGVALPTAVAGQKVSVINSDAAQTIQIWPFSGDDIDGGAADAVDASALGFGNARVYECIDAGSWLTVTTGIGDALVANPLSQFAATTSAQLAGVISDETGSGALVFGTSPTFVTPALGTPASGVATNLTGTAASLTAGTVTTNANLTGHVTSTGNAAVLGSFTSAQLLAAVSDETGTGAAVFGTAPTLTAATLAGTLSGDDNTVSRVNLLDYGEVTNAIGSTGGGAQSIDLTLGNSVSATVDTSANTFTFDNPTASDELCGFTLTLTNGGSQTVNWPASVDWAAATAPTLTASGVDVLVFYTIDGGTIWHGMIASTASA